MVYVSNLSRPSNQQLVAKQYKVSVDKLIKHISSGYKAGPNNRFYKGKQMESHLYERIQPAEFYDKHENVLASQMTSNNVKNAFKTNIDLGYDLISKTEDSFTQYCHPNRTNNNVFERPVAINSIADIRSKVISEIRSMELVAKLNYPSSGYKLKAITGFKIYIYHRNHALGDSAVVITKVIRDNQHVTNFPKTNHKCIFHCIAWHSLRDGKKDPPRIQAQVKEVFKSYCSYKGIR
ncbi:hypothetical protein F441_18387 [Phytophthora nicotianae CJ01A1]|uniref:Uncharacterized protein n=5 Tax=Phytophthora nicotianae TaxID=4792 RepID=W2PLD6_PHYN3|nr:hypothetical protein PPTG_17330 [Phytophthora nicotianae INRA-310]ETI35090.1 hypothetical protein F443_18523 [Phytophthora nicotianae P1569]ETL28791.1 hypothetical protein L916_17912 [Phytophthora nicotianae]ETO63860.1 hypothetical protein F444_18514 [Phytophthora nicotianae P1976]ETP04928.1 hypothetical protein F441_18387 [Phytophthora nicotianae CJ01A1]ETL82042.1 hypothetical protein L917_17738 [Phytophthora nicotianae]